MGLNRVAWCATAIAFGWLPQSALAADMVFPTYPTALLPPAAYDWSGHYIGATLGYGWGNATAGEISLYDDPLVDPVATLDGFNFGTSGFIGGIEAGANWQMRGLVLGVVGDISAANITGSYFDEDNQFGVDSTINWLGTARLNLGLPVNNLLFYGTGGLAFGGVTNELHDVYGSGTIHTAHKSTNVGWTIGAGVAVALNENWILKGEYLFVDLGTTDVSYREPDPGWPLVTTTAKATASIGRVSLDYKF
jgi:outer membrane immunogenic protein